MLDLIIAIVTACSVSTSDAEALQRTAPAYLASVDVAAEHLCASRAAAALVPGVDPDDLLSIAWHESRYTPAVSTDEHAGYWWPQYGADPVGRWSSTRWSCGVATPWPHPWRCEPWELEVGGGYLAAARHLGVWLAQAHGNRVAALAGYGGQAVGQFTWRAAWIKRERRARREVPTS